VLRGGLLRNADAGERAKQAIESVDVGVTGFGEIVDTADFIGECIGDAETGSGAEYAAAGVGHRHFDEGVVRYDVADSAGGLGHSDRDQA
jgi:hypothetical protein